MISPYDMTYMIWPISRLNSGIKNRNNFFVWEFFSIQKIGTDSVNQADFGDIRIPWEIDFKIIVRSLSILKFLEVTQCVYIFTPVIFLCNIRSTYLIFSQPTQFQPP